MYQSLFSALDCFLLEHASLWRNQPFTQNKLDWESDYPQLAAWLRAQNLGHAEQYQLEPWQLAKQPEVPQPFAQWAAQVQALTAVDSFVQQTPKAVPEQLIRGIPGRKWQQINAFAACLPAHWQGGQWLDWCAGKGYLGRYLAWPHDCLCSLEYNPQLAAAGQDLSRAWQLPAQHPCCDALSSAAEPWLQQSDNWVALHACGDLHTHLLRQAGAMQVKRLAVAPCCYNRTTTELYAPLSSAGQASGLQLDRQALALPLQATVTAGQGEILKRNTQHAWRLAFDGLQRQWRGVDSYLPVPSKAGRGLEHDFARWCQALAELKGVMPEPVADWSAAEQLGWQRLAQVRNLELVQGLFRRPLELWLVLDMALFLQEQGFVVQLGQFCDQQLTPRNLLLLAERA